MIESYPDRFTDAVPKVRTPTFDAVQAYVEALYAPTQQFPAPQFPETDEDQ